jgi:excisionase family DNA binding protein
MPTDDKTLMTVSDAAELAGVHPRTVRRWIDEGKLASVEVYPTHRVRVRRDDVDVARRPKDRDK